nr:hypothetical protein [Hassalia byssoidea]
MAPLYAASAFAVRSDTADGSSLLSPVEVMKPLPPGVYSISIN